MRSILIALPKKISPNGTPIYLQIAAILQKQIARGKLAAGTRLPPERELAEMLRVNRITLRQALQELEAKGLLMRRQGDGNYVAEPVIERQADKIFSFTIGLQKRGFKVGAKIVRLEQRVVDPSLAANLKIRAHARVYDLHRLRFVNDEPVSLERYALPVALFPDLEKCDLKTRSMYEVMRNEYGIRIANARQSLEPVSADQYGARLLKVKVGAALMLEKRLSFDKHGKPVEYGSDLYRGDRFRFVTEMASLEL